MMSRLIRIALSVLLIVLLVSAVLSLARSCAGKKSEVASALSDSTAAVSPPREQVLVRSILISEGSAKTRFSVFNEVSPWLEVGGTFERWTVTRIAPDSVTVARGADTLTVGISPLGRGRS